MQLEVFLGRQWECDHPARREAGGSRDAGRSQTAGPDGHAERSRCPAAPLAAPAPCENQTVCELNMQD